MFLEPEGASITAGAYASGDGDSDADSTTEEDPYYATAGSSTFTAVSGATNTWEGYIAMDVMVSGQVSGEGDYQWYGYAFYESYGEGAVNEDVTARLTIVDGQRVQADL